MKSGRNFDMFIIDFDDTLFDTESLKQTWLGGKRLDEQTLIAVVKRTMTLDDLKALLFPDTISFLTELKGYGEPMVLVSHGSVTFQNMKIDPCGIRPYFDESIIVPESKVAVVEKKAVASNTGVWFINDKIQETKEIVAAVPTIWPALKVSRRFSLSDYEQSKLPYFQTLTEVANYVREQKQ